MRDGVGTELLVKGEEHCPGFEMDGMDRRLAARFQARLGLAIHLQNSPR
jgi:hypothetical protein